MLTTRLIHPEILGALASLGHGSNIMIADGNYPFRTAVGANARIVYLNLTAGSPTVDHVLEVLQAVVPFEAAVLMRAPQPAPVQDRYRSMLGEQVPVELVERLEFYERVRSPETGLVIATGEERIYANLLLTIGVV